MHIHLSLIQVQLQLPRNSERRLRDGRNGMARNDEKLSRRATF